MTRGPDMRTACLMAITVSAVLSSLSGHGGFVWCGGLALAGFVVLDWHAVRRSGRILLLVSLGLTGVALHALPDALPVLFSALAQGLNFVGLLVALASLRPVMQRSALLARAAIWLTSRPAGRRYAAVTFGGHGLALVFNVGVVQLIGDLLAGAGLHAGKHRIGQDMLLGVMRGSSAIAIWSPLTMGFAVATTSFPALNPVAYFSVGLLLAVSLLVIGCFLPGQARDTTADISPTDVGGGTALVVLLAGASVLLFSTTFVYLTTGLAFLTIATVLIPLFSAVWLFLEPGAAGERPAPSILMSRLGDMNNEMFIFASSTIIGAIVGVTLASHGSEGGLVFDSVLLPPVVLIAIWGLAAISLPPSVPVILMAQLLAAAPLAAEHALSLALALSAGWALGMLVSPVSATLLLASRITQRPSYEIAWSWNRGYSVLALILSALTLMLIYRLE